MQRLDQIKTQLSQGFKKVKLDFADEGRIAIIYLNSPKELNALSTQMRKEIGTSCKAFDQDDTVKVMLIMSTSSKAFCAGANIQEFPSLSFESQLYNDIFAEFDSDMSNLAKPLIIAIEGLALGGGLELSLFGDILVCSEEAKFGLPEIKLGLIPGLGGTQRLPKLIGRVNASRFILTGEFFGAQDALRMGLVSNVYKKETFKEEVMKLAQQISSKSRTTLITAKKAIKQSEEMGVTLGTKFERSIFNPLFNTEAAKEGITAFRNKKQPNFSKF